VTQWGAAFGDDVLAAAILDRLLHRSEKASEAVHRKVTRNSGLLRDLEETGDWIRAEHGVSRAAASTPGDRTK
jgi:hypothetical protein